MQNYFIGELGFKEIPDILEMEVFKKEQDMDFAIQVGGIHGVRLL